MTLSLELGQVSDPTARRALEQIALRWPQGGGGGGSGGGIEVVTTLPPTGSDGDTVFVAGDDSMWVWEGGTWNRVSPGPAGATGPQGLPGAQGPAGPTGATGPTGPAGADSTVPGPQGPQGIQGLTGATGSQGPIGLTGSQGPIGNTGSQGPTGNTGPAGTPGEMWFTGSGAPAGSLAGSVLGDWYIDSATGDYYEKTGASAWTLRGNLRGPQGATGSQGIQGIQGPQGNTGSTGAPGSVWRSGSGAPAGALGVVGDWYLNTANGDVHEKTGASAWTLRDNITGPQGIQGIQGPTGNTGTTGSQGPQGSLWRSGTGAPSGALGVVGDWYENDATGDIYEKTGASAYTLRDNLTGPQGPQGTPGAGAPDATTTTKGSIQLAGDLTGTAASPQIAAGVIVDADVNGSAAIAESKLSLATDAAAGTGSRRTIGTGALQACAGNDARLTNSRAPTTHATTHQPGGADAMAVDAAAATGSLRTLGTGAAQAAAGNDARFTDARAPTGTAGGDLSGSYPNPQIAAGVITDADVAAANKDGAVGTASLRTLGTGATQAAPGNDSRFAGAMFYSGAGVPSAGVGVNGAIYLNTTNGRMYGPKAAGAWPATPIPVTWP